MADKKTILKGVLDGIKMSNAGIKPKKHKMSVDSCISCDDGVRYPSLYLNAKQAPSIAEYEVEDEIIMVVKGKITSHSKDEGVGKEARETFDIQIKEIGISPKKK